MATGSLGGVHVDLRPEAQGHGLLPVVEIEHDPLPLTEQAEHRRVERAGREVELAEVGVAHDDAVVGGWVVCLDHALHGGESTVPGAGAATSRAPPRTRRPRPAAAGSYDAHVLLARSIEVPALARVGWVVTLVTVGGVLLVFAPGGAEPFAVPKESVLVAGTVVALALRLAERLTGGRPAPWPRVAPAVAAYGAALVLATITALSPVVALLGWPGRQTGLVTALALLALAGLVVVHTWRRPERLWSLAAVLVGATAAHAAFVVVAHFGWDVRWNGSTIEPLPRGTMGNSNFAGAQPVIALPLVLALRVRAGRTAWRHGADALVVLFVAALWFADSRGAFLALPAGVAVAGWLAHRLVPRWLIWASTAFAVAALLLLAGVTVLAVRGSAVPTSTRFDTTTLAERIQYWRGAVPMVAARPVTGVGPDNFVLGFPRYAPDDLLGRPFAVEKVHDIVLERVTDAGVVGLAAYLAVLGLVLAAVLAARRSIDGGRSWLLAGFGGAAAAYLVQGLVSIDAIPLALDGWVALAALVVLSDPWLARARARADAATAEADGVGTDADAVDADAVEGDAVGAATGRRRPVVTAALAGIAVVAAALVVLALVPWVADRRLATAEQLATGRSAPSTAEVIAAFDDAIALDPVSPGPRAAAATAMVGLADATGTSDADRRQLVDEALRRATEALAQAPHDISTGLVAAQARGAQARLGDRAAWADADRRYRELAADAPGDPLVAARHAELLTDWALVGGAPERRAEAVREVDRAAAASAGVTWWRPWYVIAVVNERLGRRDQALAAARTAAALEPPATEPRRLIDRLLSAG